MWAISTCISYTLHDIRTNSYHCLILFIFVYLIFAVVLYPSFPSFLILFFLPMNWLDESHQTTHKFRYRPQTILFLQTDEWRWLVLANSTFGDSNVLSTCPDTCYLFISRWFLNPEGLHGHKSRTTPDSLFLCVCERARAWCVCVLLVCFDLTYRTSLIQFSAKLMNI